MEPNLIEVHDDKYIYLVTPIMFEKFEVLVKDVRKLFIYSKYVIRKSDGRLVKHGSST